MSLGKDRSVRSFPLISPCDPRSGPGVVAMEEEAHPGAYPRRTLLLMGASKNLERMARAAIIRPDEALRREDTGSKYPTEEQQSMGE